MKRTPYVVLVAILFLSTSIITSSAAEKTDNEEDHPDMEVRYHSLRTKDLNLFYFFKDQEYILDHLSRCFENAFQYHQKFFDYEPSGPVTVFFNDSDDYGYAGTTTIPNNWITLGIEPFEYVYDTCPTNERMNWVMNHELVHIVASDQATGWDKVFRRAFFGKVAPTAEDPVSIFYSYLTNPRRYAPRWYHEGIAVFMETWMAGGIGRTLTGYDEMTFRAMVMDSSYFYDIVGLESEGTAKDFQIGQNSYLYGTRFFSYLALKYGPENLIKWVKRDKGSKRYFSRQFKHVYDRSLNDEWAEWIEFEREWQLANIDSIRQYPVTEYRVLSGRPLGSVSRQFFDPEKRVMYAAVNYPGDFAHIEEIDIDTGASRKICEIATPALYYVTSLAYDDSTSTLFYTTDNSKGWRDLNTVDINTGKTRVVMKNNRTGDLVLNRKDHSIWGVQHDNGRSRIVVFPYPYEDGFEALALRYGKDIFDIDISPDGKYLTGTLAGISGSQKLVRMETARLLSFDTSYEVLWEFKDNNAANFVFSPCGRYLFGTSYYTGTSNVFRFDCDTKEMEAVSNCEIGFFRPLPVSADSLIVFRYTGDGFQPVMIENKTIEDVCAVRYLGQAVIDAHPIVDEWKLGSPRDINLDSLTVYKGDYHVVRNIDLNSLYPIAEGYKDYTAVGFRANMMDPVGINSLDLAMSYSPDRNVPDDEKIHARFKYSKYPWTVSGAWNRADFYDFFGPTKISRKGYSMAVKYDHTFITDRPRKLSYTIGVAGYGGLETLPDYQNVSTSFDEFYTASAELRYSNLRATIGRIESEKGIKWTLGTFASSIRSKIYPLAHMDLDIGFLTPIDHSSIWLRTSIGYSFGDREEPYANFYFGGFGNNWIDHASFNRYRKYYSFPGVELNEIGGNNYGKAMLEWTLPPVRFKSLGIPACYLNWSRLALFTTGIVTNIDSDDMRREVFNAGTQLNTKVVLFSSLESTFSIGYAVSFEDGRGPEEEFMISLKILR
ncbi:MAG: hypothetical protein KAV42_01085 [Candidatus Krumholzibacteria bacterium]|nr:hypothetical protein [Candidatus Krumholzibacteria bacterium]